MEQNLAEKLRRKGWPDEDIEKTMGILQSETMKKKHIRYKTSMNPILYWSALILTMVGNLVISVVMVPFLVMLEGFQLYFVIVLLGGSFGLLFSLIINDIENMGTEHHLMAGAFIPSIAIINVLIIVRLSNVVSEVVLNNGVKQNALMVAFFYVGSFIAPYIITKASEAMRRSREKEIPSRGY